MPGGTSRNTDLKMFDGLHERPVCTIATRVASTTNGSPDWITNLEAMAFQFEIVSGGIGAFVGIATGAWPVAERVWLFLSVSLRCILSAPPAGTIFAN